MGRPFVVTMLVAFAAAGSWFAYEAYGEQHVTLIFANGEEPVPALELTFFPEQLAFAAPSPPPPLGQQHIEPGANVEVGAELVPGHAVVRYRGEGIGTGFAHVQLGTTLPPIRLRPPQTLTGRVGEPMAFWCMGWRCTGFRPVANAEVVIMGGGEHGVDLATAHTDAQGRFTVQGFDGELHALGLRVRAAGFAISHERVQGLLDRLGDRTIVALTPAPPRRGHLQLSVDLDLASLRLLARGLPGVEAVPAADGSFTMDHIPSEFEARIVVHGLPDNCAQEPVRTRRGQDVQVAIVAGAIVSGRVLDRELQPVARALVWIGEEPAVRTDEDGNYRLVRVLPGSTQVFAQRQIGKGRRARKTHGSRSVVLEPSRHHTNIDITLN